MSDAIDPATDETSSYLRYLPAIYQEDEFIGQFLRIFETILSPIQVSVNTLPDQFDPRFASSPMLDVLAAWVHARRPPNAPEGQWRSLVAEAVWLHRWRGSKRGLRRAIEVVCGQRPLITEYADGLVLGRDAALGTNTSADEGHALHVRIALPSQRGSIDSALLTYIIDLYKPAGVGCSVSYQNDAGVT